MSELLDYRAAARSLRRRLNDHAVDIELLAAEAAVVFQAAGSATHVRWLDFERQGYASLASVSTLHDALGVAASDRLVVHVFAYRSQSGQILGDTAGGPVRHFFVDPLREIVAGAASARAGDLREVLLDFGAAGPSDYPAGVRFPPDVFERILLGLRATLHLQLGSIAA